MDTLQYPLFPAGTIAASVCKQKNENRIRQKMKPVRK
jgi:hypothetical protein